MTNWDHRMLQLAAHVAQWSKDPSTKVGAVIADDQHRVLSMGYNGFPRGIEDTEARYANRDIKYSLVVHAEMNAILNTGVPMALEGTAIFLTLPPCQECAKAIVQAGIKRVVVAKYTRFDVEEGRRLKRWEDSWQAAEIMFQEAGITLEYSDGYQARP